MRIANLLFIGDRQNYNFEKTYITISLSVWTVSVWQPAEKECYNTKKQRRVARLSFFRESVFTFPLNPPLTKGDLFLLNVLPNTPADNSPSPTHIMRVAGIECDLLLDF